MIIFIENIVQHHYEILESIILKFYKILKIQNTKYVCIYLSIIENKTYSEYIQNKYPDIYLSIPNNFDYYISATIYDRDYYNIFKNSNKYFYISHDVSERLKKLSNVIFLTPLNNNNYIICDKLPYIKNIKRADIPIYIIQGAISADRRYYKLLCNILDYDYEYDFIIKLIGAGNDLPEELKKYSNKIIFKPNLGFKNFHKEFLDAYCIIPSITKKTHPQYYTNKLTSSINYCIGYNLKCLIDKDLQDIYNLKNVEIFNDENDITDAFKKTLVDFYSEKQLYDLIYNY